MLLVLVQIAFRATTRMPRSARGNYFLAVSCGSELKRILRGMQTQGWEEREADFCVLKKRKAKTKQNKTPEMTPLIADGLTSIRKWIITTRGWPGFGLGNDTGQLLRLLERIRAYTESNGNWLVSLSESAVITLECWRQRQCIYEMGTSPWSCVCKPSAI